MACPVQLAGMLLVHGLQLAEQIEALCQLLVPFRCL